MFQMLSEDELKQQLKDILNEVAHSQNIKSFEINIDTGANYGDGFVGQFYKGEVQDKETGEVLNVAIKKAPIWGDGDFGVDTLFSNEILFYQTAFPVLDTLQKEANVSQPFDNIPKYLCGDLEPKKEYLAMENLKLLGYDMSDKIKCFDKQHLDTIFKLYGKFHALSYVLRIKDSEKFESIIKQFSDVSKVFKEFADQPMKAAVAAAVNSLDPEKDETIKDELKTFGEYCVDIFIDKFNYNGKHRILVHGDCWSNNMLFKYSESGDLLDIKLIDFQLSQANTPVHDLSYFFYSGASKEDFDKLDDYLQIYYNSFCEFSKELGSTSEEIFSFQELKNEWIEYAIWGVLMGIYLWQLKLIPKSEVTEMVSGVTDTEQNSQNTPMSMEEGLKIWAARLEQVHSTDLYKERTSDILRHAFEYGVINRNKIVRSKE